MWSLPLVSFHTSQVSTVPKASSPFSALALAFGILSSSHWILLAEKKASTSSPVFSRIVLPFEPLIELHISDVRRSCQTMALWIG